MLSLDKLRGSRHPVVLAIGSTFWCSPSHCFIWKIHMSWVKEIGGVLLLLAIAEGFPYLIIASADGDPLEALRNVIRALVLGFGIYAYVSYQSAKDIDRLVEQLNARLERHDKQIRKLQGWDD